LPGLLGEGRQMLKKTLAYALLLCPFLGAEPQAEVEQRVRDLLRQMNLEEKLGQLQQVGPAGGVLSAQDREAIVQGRMGSTLSFKGAAQVNEAQRLAQQSRLKIPLLVAHDVIHGYKTIFPIPLGEACTWNPQLLEQASAAAASEAYADGIRWVYAPMVDVSRDPRWGRVAEGAGEDPYLGGVMAAARVRGFQGEELSRPFKVAACAKHWVAYGAAQGGRDYNSVDVSERALREVYFPPFQAAVEEGVASLMSSFNDVAGVPASANYFILNQVLRNEWKFDGVVVSDYTAIDELQRHGIAANGSEAAAAGLNGGVDVEMVSRHYNQSGSQLVRDKKVPLEVLDEAVKRVLRLKFRLGLFENSQTDESLPGQYWLKPEHRQLARKVATESLVLLQNRGNLLPLSKKVKKVALIGPLGDAPDDQLGTWRGEGQAKDTLTLLTGLRQELPQARVEYLKGCSADGKGKAQIEAAVKLARQSEVVILALGESAEMSGEANSRSRLDLPGQQLQLLQAVMATGKPCVVVLMNGRPLCLDWVWKHCPAVLEAWHPGTEGGPAIADVLFGDANPSGKLTMSFPRSEGQIPVFYNHRNTGRPYNPADKYTSHYRDLPNTPQFAFGHGLSYTRFELSNLQVSPSKGSLGREFQAQVDLTNTGQRAGAEVVQLYVRDKVASISRPVRELKGFQKVELAPGESRTVRFRLGTRELGMFDGQMNFRVEPGEFEVMVGQSSEGGLSQVVEVVP